MKYYPSTENKIITKKNTYCVILLTLCKLITSGLPVDGGEDRKGEEETSEANRFTIIQCFECNGGFNTIYIGQSISNCTI